MKLNDTIMEEAKLLLEYEAPALREIELGLAFGTGIDDDPDIGNSGAAIFGADGGSEDENETYSLDDY